jgi:hypothetical protein
MNHEHNNIIIIMAMAIRHPSSAIRHGHAITTS